MGQAGSYDWGNNVLNGIAYNPWRRTFYITGKRWDFMFEMDLKEF
jgi:glutamine cyclotransferase